MHKKSKLLCFFYKVLPILKLNPQKAPVKEFNKELFSKLKVIGLQFCQACPPNMNCFKEFAKKISFLFYIFEIYVQLVLRNTLLRILLIESIFY